MNPLSTEGRTQSFEIIHGPPPQLIIKMENGECLKVEIVDSNLYLSISHQFEKIVNMLLSEKDSAQPLFLLSNEDMIFFKRTLAEGVPITRKSIINLTKNIPEELKLSYQFVVAELLKGTFNLSATKESEFSVKLRDGSEQYSAEDFDKTFLHVRSLFEKYTEELLQKSESQRGCIGDNVEMDELFVVKWFIERFNIVVKKECLKYNRNFDSDDCAEKANENVGFAVDEVSLH